MTDPIYLYDHYLILNIMQLQVLIILKKKQAFEYIVGIGENVGN